MDHALYLKVQGAHSQNFFRSSFTIEHIFDTSKGKSTGIIQQGVPLSEGDHILIYTTF